MGTHSASWLNAHGKLWYDDRWYRAAWIVWPQALGSLVFVWVWMMHPAEQAPIPWAQPSVEQKKLAVAPGVETPKTPSPQAQPLDPLASCKGNDWSRIIQACSAVIAAGDMTVSDTASAYWLRGWAYYSTQQYQSSLADYNQAVALTPRNHIFYNDRGVLWIALDRRERALQDFDQAISIKPDYALAVQNRGIALRYLKRADEALAALTAAISLDPKLWLAYEHRAFVYEDRGEWRPMWEDANKLIELRPDYRMGYEFRGHAYLEAGQYDAAIADFTKAINLDPKAIYGWRTRGRSHYYLGHYAAAASDLQAALQIDPKDGDTIRFLDDLRRKQGR